MLLCDSHRVRALHVEHVIAQLTPHTYTAHTYMIDVQGPNAPQCALEVHPGNMVQYSAHYLEQVCSKSGSQNGAADPQQAPSVSADQVHKAPSAFRPSY